MSTIATSDLDITLGKPKDVGELVQTLNPILQDFLVILQTLPPFLIRTDPNEGLPESTKFGTIIFDVDSNNDLQIGIYNGQTIIYKT
jgi:hypothetical protein